MIHGGRRASPPRVVICDPGRTCAISSLGWVDGDALWRFEAASGRIERIALGSGARYLSLHTSGGSRFAVAHRFDGKRFGLTVHEFSDPARVLARAEVTEGGPRLTGDVSVWQGLPRLYVAYLAFAPWDDFVLLRVSPGGERIEPHRLAWYDGTFDKDYQGIVDALELPGGTLALVSVQRSSRLVLHDLATGASKGFVDLAGRAGNPSLRFGLGCEEIWATDYDTLVAIRTEDRRVRGKKRLQGAWTGTQQFIGEFSLAPEQGLCVVARPFSGDVAGVDMTTLRITCTARLGRQPFEAVALRDGDVVARDWKTGDLLRGTLERRRWFGR